MTDAESRNACPLSELPIMGKASCRKSADGRIIIRATHALAMLRLIEQQGNVQIKILRAEVETVRDWPCRRFDWILENDSQTAWANAAIELLKKGPPPIELWPRLLALAAALFVATFLFLDWYFRTRIVFQ